MYPDIAYGARLAQSALCKHSEVDGVCSLPVTVFSVTEPFQKLLFSHPQVLSEGISVENRTITHFIKCIILSLLYYPSICQHVSIHYLLFNITCDV